MLLDHHHQAGTLIHLEPHLLFDRAEIAVIVGGRIRDHLEVIERIASLPVCLRRADAALILELRGPDRLTDGAAVAAYEILVDSPR